MPKIRGKHITVRIIRDLGLITGTPPPLGPF